MSCMDDAPDIAFYNSHIVKRAKKQHICCMCKQPIAIGSAYRKICSVEDGEFSMQKHHLRHD